MSGLSYANRLYRLRDCERCLSGLTVELVNQTVRVIDPDEYRFDQVGHIREIRPTTGIFYIEIAFPDGIGSYLCEQLRLETTFPTTGTLQ